jgi:hypothetical protein
MAIGMSASQEETRIVPGTATPGGGFPAYDWPYAEILNEADATLAIEPVNSKGSNENVAKGQAGGHFIAPSANEIKRITMRQTTPGK